MGERQVGAERDGRATSTRTCSSPIDDGVRVITIDRPEAKNALDSAMRTAFIELIADADADPEVHAIVITATDPVFSAGVDFKEPMQAAVGRTPVRRRSTGRCAPIRRRRCGPAITPTICAVNGACVSGALEIALSCTFAIASERARFADTHAAAQRGRGLGPRARCCPARSALRKAREMSITGNFVDADEALRIGLVNHVVPHDELLARVPSRSPAMSRRNPRSARCCGCTHAAKG